MKYILRDACDMAYKKNNGWKSTRKSYLDSVAGKLKKSELLVYIFKLYFVYLRLWIYVKNFN